MRKQKLIFIGLSCLATMLGACSSEEEGRLTGGTATLALKVQTETSFQTKALDEKEYEDKNIYNVALYTEEGDTINHWGPSYGNYLPQAPVEVSAGTYRLKAWCGNPNTAASTTQMYVEGISDPVTVSAPANDSQATTQTISVTCTPRCAKVTINFSAEMSTYFKNYKATIHTAALTHNNDAFVWNETATDPVYLKVNDNEQITVDFTQTKTDGTDGPKVSKKYTLSPQQALNIAVAPVQTSENGQISIGITVDTDTNDQEHDFELPTDATGQTGQSSTNQ